MGKVVTIRGILFSVMLMVGSVWAQKLPYGIKLSKNIFLDKTEITVREWDFYYWDTKNTHGVNSEKVYLTLPDTVLFAQVYGCSFFEIYGKKGMSKEENQAHRNKILKLPMTCISYEQVVAYCQWRAEQVNFNLEQKHKSYRVVYSLPGKEDYELALSKALITQKEPLSLVVASKTKFTGLTDNVAEFTKEQQVVSGQEKQIIEVEKTDDLLVGFRCVGTIEKK